MACSVNSCSVAIPGRKTSATDFNAFANTNLGQSDLDVFLHGPSWSGSNADTIVADDGTRFGPVQKSVTWPYVKPTSKSCMPFPVKVCSSLRGSVIEWVSRAEILNRYSAKQPRKC